MSRQITCPLCGNSGDQNGEDSAQSFEVRGRFQGSAVRKCLRCGTGLMVGLFSGIWFGKPSVIPYDLWQKMDTVWRERALR